MGSKAAALARLQESEIPSWAWEGIRRRAQNPEPLAGPDRRRHPRIATDDPAVMRILEPFSPIRWIVRVVDVSKSGMRLLTPTPIPTGAMLQVHLKETSVLAVVRHCTPAAEPDQHYAGIEIQHLF